MVTHFSSGWLVSITRRSLAIAISVAMSGISGSNVYADEPADHSANAAQSSRLKLKPERVIVFKDGYCLVVKQAVATTDVDGNVFTDEVPNAAVLGSFWVVPEKGTIKTTIAGWVNFESKTNREISCTSIIEVIKSNLGKECSFAMGEQQIEGTLLKLLSTDDTPNENPGSPHDSHPFELLLTSASMPATQTPTTTISSVTGAWFLVRTRVGDKLIQANSVSDLTIEDMNSSIKQTVTTKSQHKRLTMKFAEANTDIKLNLMYFRPDVRWIPTYRLNLTGQPLVDQKSTDDGMQNERKKAELIMQGEILNEAEDFINVPFHVVVGVPNFRFRSIPSPMVLEATMRNLLSQAAPNIMGMANNVVSNGMYSQRAGEFSSNRAAGDDARTEVALPDELVGKGGNDLFVYELPPMTLKRGERAMVPILRTEVAYRDIYTWDIELTHSESYAATTAESPSPLILSEAKVWRQVELINNTDIPWTTGAAMLVDGKQPLAQELLTYTSPGGICRVPVTISVDLRGKAEDTEVNRSYNALQWRGSEYARIEGKIEVELANNKTESVPVEVRLRFGGKATKVSDEGKITLESFRIEDWRDNRGNPINNSSAVRWSATIAPGECFKPVVNYDFLLQH